MRPKMQMSPNCGVLEGVSIKGGLERDGILLAIEGERRDEVRQQLARWLQEISQSKP